MMMRFALTVLLIWNTLLGWHDTDIHHLAIGFVMPSSSSSRSSIVSLLSLSSSEENLPLFSRREAMFASGLAALLPLMTSPHAANAAEAVPYELHDRKGNKGAIIAEDYWYMTAKIPPRKLDAPLVLDGKF